MTTFSPETLGIDVAEIDARLADNWSLPTRFYSDPAIFDFEMEAIFAKGWLYFGSVHQVANPGDVAVKNMGRWPIVVTRDRAGELHAFYNICRHRGYTVAERDQSKCLRLVCRYHAWSYNLDGTLAHAPDADGEAGFDKDALGLRRVVIAQWGPAIFVNPGGKAPPLSEFWGEAYTKSTKGGLAPDPDEYELVREVVYDVETNWKLWYDNGAECYHCRWIHGQSFADAYLSEAGTYETELGPNYTFNMYHGRARDGSNSATTDNPVLQAFPGFVGFGDGDIVHHAGMVPMAPDRTRHTTHYYARRGTDPGFVKDWCDLWDLTYREDNVVTADQQINLASGLQPWNRYVNNREFGAQHISREIWRYYKAALAA
ncbi:MAG: aromatic ring-hydroxylating dioxygenase subunit alpha [Rhodospirillales bacterium]|nr:aromatic ring-hydroxylating dioxygenase subunit alpha [Rhodospirillales bacterium]